MLHSLRRKLLFVGIISLLGWLSVLYYYSRQDDVPAHHEMLSAVRRWQKEAGISKVMGLVFYGRRETASILDCYLKRHLAKNGGILDGVIWLERTTDVDDLKLLEKLIASEPDYVKQQVNSTGRGYADSYDNIDDDVLYVKIDTDIVFFEDITILAMAHLRATRPDYFLVGANVVNQPLSSWLHWSLSAVKPYLPEQEAGNGSETAKELDDWRPSLLPTWNGTSDFDVNNWTPPVGKKHRWLPAKILPGSALNNTPIVQTEYDLASAGWYEWKVGAQQHYSMLENLEKNEMWRYRFHTWNYRNLRMGLQFVAMTGKDINLSKPIEPDDEGHFTKTMPERTSRDAVAEGAGVAVHYSFYAQSSGMNTTDILDRYRLYAKEHICKGEMLWKPGEL